MLGTKVVIRGKRNRGKVEISYYSQEDLERITGIITGKKL
jgi:ParB family chromosome partitioning protein